jgi:ABC-type glycerol-3-phosphate transport system substrate-binding protein
MRPIGLSRRDFLARTALAGTATVAAPFVRGAHAAGRLSCGFWDHWVPGANDTLTKLCREWGERERVDVTIDYITSQGEKNRLTIMSESQARTGHDVLAMATWYPSDQANNLVPVDDIVTALIAEHGKPSPAVEYLGKVKGHWIAVPATAGSQAKPPCARMDLFKQYVGWDPREMYPAGAPPNVAMTDMWTWDEFLRAAAACHKAGYPFGMPLSHLSDAVDWTGAVFAAHGAQLVDVEGKITVNSDATRQVLEWFRQLVPLLPPDVVAWDDAGNNKWLVSGKGALIMNPPSAWAVAKRDAPQIAEQLWTFGAPRGPNGRYSPFLPYYWGIWNFSSNQSAAKSLLIHLSRRESVERLVAASSGYDIPAFERLHDFPTWREQGPPTGTIYHYPPRGNQIPSVAAAPAPPTIANQIYTQGTMTKMVARCTLGGESVEKTIAWATDELAGFMRT